MPKIKLNHHCNVPGAKGLKGDVIEVSEEKARQLLGLGGGAIVPEPKQEPVQKDEPANESEDSEKEKTPPLESAAKEPAPENAAQRTGKPPKRGQPAKADK